MANASENPYSTPQALVDDPADESDYADRIQNKTNRAVIAGVTSGVITLLLTSLIVTGSESLPKESVLLLGDFVLDAGLTYGIYRKSRACAVAMFAYSLIFKIVVIVMLWNPSDLRDSMLLGSIVILPGCFFLYFYFHGMLGTFAYRKRLKAALTTGT